MYEALPMASSATEQRAAVAFTRHRFGRSPVPPSAVPPIGARLRAARQARGRSVRGLAREIGVSASLISQIETDKISPSVSTLYAITTELGISIEDLFGQLRLDEPPVGETPVAASE